MTRADASPPAPASDLSPRGFAWGLAVMVVLVMAWSQAVTVTQWQSQRVFLSDVGVFNVLCSGPWHGNWLRTPLAWHAEGNYFGIHFQPILFVVSLLYGIADHVLTLLTVQTGAIVLAAVPLALFARSVTGHRGLALAFAALFLGNHFTGSIQLANHPESLAFPGLFTLFVAIERRQRGWTIAAFLWTVAVKQDFAGYLALFGATLLLEREKRRWGAAIIVGSIAWLLLAMLVMKACGSEWFAANGHTAEGRYASFGSSRWGILAGMATHPHVVAARVLLRPTFWVLLASVAGLALLDFKGVWTGLAAAALFLVSDDYVLKDLLYYYSYGALPFIFYSAVRGARTIVDWAGANQHGPAVRSLIRVLVAAALVQAVMATRADGYRRVPFMVTDYDRLIRDVAAHIPPDAAVGAQFGFFPQVANRKTLLPLRSTTFADLDMLFFDVAGRFPDISGDPVESQLVVDELESERWQPYIMIDGVCLLQRAAPQPPPKPD